MGIFQRKILTPIFDVLGDSLSNSRLAEVMADKFEDRLNTAAHKVTKSIADTGKTIGDETNMWIGMAGSDALLGGIAAGGIAAGGAIGGNILGASLNNYLQQQRGPTLNMLPIEAQEKIIQIVRRHME